MHQFAIDTSKIIFCGCSQGAALALSAAVHNTEIRKIIAVAGGNDLSIYLQKMNRDPVFRAAFEKKLLLTQNLISGVIQHTSTIILIR